MRRAIPHLTKDNGGDLSPSVGGTMVILFGCGFAALMQPEAGQSPTEVLRVQAMVIGVSLLGSLALDYQVSLRNLIRVDVVSLLAFYFLTYVEFLFPQPDFDAVAQGYQIASASAMVILGIASLAVGRHANIYFAENKSRAQLGGLLGNQIQTEHWLLLFWIAAGMGYLHMLLATNFNIMAIVEAMMRPRFDQPWGRGKFGNWKALIYELGMFLFLVPPIYGVLFARRKRLNRVGFLIASLVTLLTLFHGFAGGTRNVFATYMAGMVGAYLLVQHRLTIWKVAFSGGVAMLLLLFSTREMLAFRQIGLANYLKYGGPESVDGEEEGGLFVDANILNLAMLIGAFDTQHEPIGLNVPFNAIIRPIPRAIWPGKPEGLAIGIEEAVGMEGLTLSVTFVGESYMAARAWGVLISGLLFGGFCGYWNAKFSGQHGAYARLLYSAGFFPAAITMRSLFAFTTALLPIFGLLAIAWWLNRNQAQKAKQNPVVRKTRIDDTEPKSSTTLE